LCRDDREREVETKERDKNSELRDTHGAQAGGGLWEMEVTVKAGIS